MPSSSVPFSTLPLHSHFGVEVLDVDLRLLPNTQFSELRALFDQHSLLLFRNQVLSDDEHLNLASKFGPIEYHEEIYNNTEPSSRMRYISNAEKDSVYDENDIRALELKSNMLWHTDSSFLPIPALTNVLVAHEVPSSGGKTEFASTRVAWNEMDERMKGMFRGKTVMHSFSHSRSKISEKLGNMEFYSRWGTQEWKALWKNPANGMEALFLASHCFGIKGMENEEAQKVIDEAIAFSTREGRVYSHDWREGDVLIWDERAMLHRGTPWDYKQRRVLKYVIVSAKESDGIESVRVNSKIKPNM